MPHNQTQNNNKTKSSLLQKIIILAGIALIIAVIFIVKNQTSQQPEITTSKTAEEVLDQYLEEGKPSFVFFHSNNCQSCIDMMKIVEQVYPEFEGSVALIDVNVYDPVNQNLLRRANIYTIPTQTFIDSMGQGKVALGVMSPEELRTQLIALVDEGK